MYFLGKGYYSSISKIVSFKHYELFPHVRNRGLLIMRLDKNLGAKT